MSTRQADVGGDVDAFDAFFEGSLPEIIHGLQRVKMSKLVKCGSGASSLLEPQDAIDEALRGALANFGKDCAPSWIFLAGTAGMDQGAGGYVQNISELRDRCVGLLSKRFDQKRAKQCAFHCVTTCHAVMESTRGYISASDHHDHGKTTPERGRAIGLFAVFDPAGIYLTVQCSLKLVSSPKADNTGMTEVDVHVDDEIPPETVQNKHPAPVDLSSTAATMRSKLQELKLAFETITEKDDGKDAPVLWLSCSMGKEQMCIDIAFEVTKGKWPMIGGTPADATGEMTQTCKFAGME